MAHFKRPVESMLYCYRCLAANKKKGNSTLDTGAEVFQLALLETETNVQADGLRGFCRATNGRKKPLTENVSK